MANGDKKNTGPENAPDKSQNPTDETWFDVEDNPDGADSLKAKHWQTEQRGVSDKSAQGNLHYGTDTEQDFIREPGNKDGTVADSTANNEVSSESSELEDQKLEENVRGQSTQEVLNESYGESESDFPALDPDSQEKESRQPDADILSTGESQQPADPLAANMENRQRTGSKQADGQTPASEEQPGAESVLPDVAVKHESQIGGIHTGTVTEDGAGTATGTLTISDVDSGDSPAFIAGETSGTYGTLTLAEDGTWSYELDNSSVQQ